MYTFSCCINREDHPWKDEKVHHNELQYITEISLKSPATMIPQAKNELRRMANMAQENLDHAIHGFLNQSDEFVDKIYHREEDINNVSHAITDYLVKSNQLSLPLADQKILGSMFYVVNDIERIGDHAENFADFTKQRSNITLDLLEMQRRDQKMYTAVSKLLKLSWNVSWNKMVSTNLKKSLLRLQFWKLRLTKWNADIKTPYQTSCQRRM